MFRKLLLVLMLFASTIAFANSISSMEKYVPKIDDLTRYALLRTILFGVEALSDADRALLNENLSDSEHIIVQPKGYNSRFAITEPPRLQSYKADTNTRDIFAGLILTEATGEVTGSSAVDDYTEREWSILNARELLALLRKADEISRLRLQSNASLALAEHLLKYVVATAGEPSALALYYEILRANNEFWRERLKAGGQPEGLEIVNNAISQILIKESVVFDIVLTTLAAGLQNGVPKNIAPFDESDTYVIMNQSRLLSLAKFIHRLAISPYFSLETSVSNHRYLLKKNLLPLVREYLNLAYGVQILGGLNVELRLTHLKKMLELAKKIGLTIAQSTYFKELMSAEDRAAEGDDFCDGFLTVAAPKTNKKK